MNLGSKISCHGTKELFSNMEKIIFLLAVKPLHSVCGGGDILQQLLNQHFFFHLDGWSLSQRNDILRLNHIQNKLNFSCWKRNNGLTAFFLIKGKWQLRFFRLIVTCESPARVQAGNDRLLIEERLFNIPMFTKDTFYGNYFRMVDCGCKDILLSGWGEGVPFLIPFYRPATVVAAAQLLIFSAH